MNKSPQELFASAWIEISVGIICVVLGLVSFQLIVSISKAESEFWSSKKALMLFSVFFLLTAACGSASALLITIFRSFDVKYRLVDIAILMLAVLLLWITAVAGKQVHQNLDAESRATSLGTFFSVVYPSYYLYLVLVIVGLVFSLSRLAAFHGLYAGQRDSSAPALRLPGVVIYSKNPLPLEGNYDSKIDCYVYKSYFFIDSNSEYIFVLNQLSSNSIATQAPSFTTFAIPKEQGITLELTR